MPKNKTPSLYESYIPSRSENPGLQELAGGQPIELDYVRSGRPKGINNSPFMYRSIDGDMVIPSRLGYLAKHSPGSIQKKPDGHTVVGSGLLQYAPSLFPTSDKSIEFRGHGGSFNVNGLPEGTRKMYAYEPVAISGRSGIGKSIFVTMPDKPRNYPSGKFDEVWSYLCNKAISANINDLKNIKKIDGGIGPEYYEEMLEQSLKNVHMVPPGKYGLPTAGVSNAPSKVLNAILPGDPFSGLVNYKKVDGEWKDTGKYSPPLDKFVYKHRWPIGIAAGGLGAAALAYYLYRRNKKKKDEGVDSGGNASLKKEASQANRTPFIIGSIVARNHQALKG